MQTIINISKEIYTVMNRDIYLRTSMNIEKEIYLKLVKK